MAASADVKVVVDDLHHKAALIEATPWPPLEVGRNPAPADALPLAQQALRNVGLDALILSWHQTAAMTEGARLAETLSNVADAYRQMDDNAAAAVDLGTELAAVLVAPCSTPPSTTPHHPSTYATLDPAVPADVIATHGALNAGDHGLALRSAADHWDAVATALLTKSESFDLSGVDWQGEAATAADIHFGAFMAWLRDLSSCWNDLAVSARTVADAHDTATVAHEPIYEQYMATLQEAKRKQNDGTLTQADAARITNTLTALNADSSDVRRNYASQATTQPVVATAVPSGAFGSTSVAADKVLRKTTAAQPRMVESSTTAGGFVKARPGPTPSTAASASTPASAQSSEAGRSPSEEDPGSGSPPSGGSPSSGSSPGGSTPTGMETPPTALLESTGPAVMPAAADVGSAGGGAGGGVGSTPLIAGIGGVGAGTSPASGPSTGGAAPVSTGTSSGMGGGMGGVPMGGQGQSQGKEKRRTPGFSPDETLYEEDRPYTDPVIGLRRRNVGDREGK